MTEPQSAERITTQIFAERAGLDFDRCTSLCQETLKECDHGELYLEHTVSEVLSLDDQRIRTASFDCSEGFGLRAV
ncbi:MAG: DNA gyrase modulator, partial [Pseudomonadota bacterium]